LTKKHFSRGELKSERFCEFLSLFYEASNPDLSKGTTNMANTGKVRLEFRGADDKLLSGKFELRFRNLRVHSLDFLQNVELQGQPLTLENVPAFPDGNWNVEIFPEKFRFKSVFISVPSNGLTDIKETFFVDPAKVTPVFPSEAEINSQPRWSALKSVLDNSPIQFAQLADQEKAGLLNLFAKMNDDSANKVFAKVNNIFLVLPARIFAEVKLDLWPSVRGLPQRFHEEPDNGSMHHFLEGWTRLAEHASFKTPDPTGNLQLTFANNISEKMAVDADLDDHKGLQHAFDVIKHKLSGNDTNPYDIHQVLVKFQHIDPGYRLN
jgi:hypothetical protein